MHTKLLQLFLSPFLFLLSAKLSLSPQESVCVCHKSFRVQTNTSPLLVNNTWKHANRSKCGCLFGLLWAGKDDDFFPLLLFFTVWSYQSIEPPAPEKLLLMKMMWKVSFGWWEWLDVKKQAIIYVFFLETDMMTNNGLVALSKTQRDRLAC